MAKKILSAADKIEELYGKGTWKEAGSSILKPIPSISSGSMLVDQAIGECNGYPEGSIVTVYGPSGAGKSLLGTLAMAASQKQHADRQNILIDAERTFRFQAKFAEKCGLDPKKLIHSEVVTCEEAFNKMCFAIAGKAEYDGEEVTKVIEPGDIGVIVVDSISQLSPRDEFSKSLEDSTRRAALAAAMGRGLRKLVSTMTIAKSKAVVILISQIRTDPNSGYEGFQGGNAVPFYSTVIMRVAKVYDSDRRATDGTIMEHDVRVKFKKNKAGQLPIDDIELTLAFDGRGVRNDLELFGVAEANKIVFSPSKGWYACVAREGNKEDEEEGYNTEIGKFRKKDFQESVYEKYDYIEKAIKKEIDEGHFYSIKNAKLDLDEEADKAAERNIDEATAIERKNKDNPWENKKGKE